MGKIFDRIHEKIKTSEQQRRDKKAEDAKLKEAAHVAEQEEGMRCPNRFQLSFVCGIVFLDGLIPEF